MTKKNQYTILTIVIAFGLVLCVLMLALGAKENQSKKKPEKNKVDAGQTKEQQTVEINNFPQVTYEKKNSLCVIKSIDSEEKKITFYDVTDAQNRTFAVKTTPTIYTEYGNATTLDQLYPGLVVDIVFEDKIMNLEQISISNKVTRFRGVTGLMVNVGYRTISFYNHVYGYNDNVVVAAKDILLSPQQISDKDLVTIYSTDEGNVISVVIDRGHGYLTLTGVDLFIDGYVTVGTETVKTIEKDMMLMLPEGQYKVSVAHNGYYGEKTVNIAADAVSTLDFSEIQPDYTEVGNIFVNISVLGAKLFLNGVETDYSEGIVTVPVGSYAVRVTAEGYDTFTDKIEVSKEYQKLTVNLTPEEAAVETEGTTQVSTESDGTESETKVSTKNKVYIDGPKGAIVYFDGTYLGTAPLSFALVTGNHTILIVEGTSAKQYAVTLAEGPDDVRYDFSNK